MAYTTYSWDTVEFRQEPNIRDLPDIRRGLLYPFTVISQYANSGRLQTLLLQLEWEIDPYLDIETFYSKVFDPRTAVGWGLDCWGQIVGISRQLELQGTEDAFGFDGSNLMPWGQGPFWSNQATTTYILADEAYRKLIFFKAAINITDGTLASLNKLMNIMFGSRGTVCVLHVGTMKIRFFFDFYLATYERALVCREDVPPKPAGVGFDVYEIPRAETFGFAGSDLQPWNQGTFQIRGPQDAYSY